MLASPYISARFVYKRWYAFFAHVPYNACWGAMAVLLVLSPHFEWSNESLLTMMTILAGANFFFAGFVSLPQQQFTAACIPMSYRGRHSAWAEGMGSATSIGITILGGWILHSVLRPVSFGILYLIGWVFCQSAFVIGLFAREEPSQLNKEPRPSLRRILTALKKDRPFLQLLLLYALFQIFFFPIATVFVVNYGFKELAMAPEAASIIVLVISVAKILTAGPVGHLTDKLRPRRTLPFCALLFSLSLLPVLVLENATGVFISCGLLAVTHICQSAAFNPLIFGLPRRVDRAGHYTTCHLVVTCSSSVGPLLIGWLCDLLSFRVTFLAVSLAAVALCPIAFFLLRGLSDAPRDALPDTTRFPDAPE